MTETVNQRDPELLFSQDREQQRFRKAYDLKDSGCGDADLDFCSLSGRALVMKSVFRAVEKLQPPDNSANWVDLRAAEDVDLKKGDFRLIRLGVAMKLPEGYEAHIVPRSSTYKNFGIIQANHYGVIDNAYSGDGDEWMVPVIAMRDTSIHINDRICQFRIIRIDRYTVIRNH